MATETQNRSRAWRIIRGVELWLVVAMLALTTPAAASGARNHVRSVRVVADARDLESADLVVSTTGIPRFHVRRSQDGRRLFVDVFDSDVKGAKSALTNMKGPIQGVLTQTFAGLGETAPRTRLTVHVGRTATYRARIDGTKLLISVRGGADEGQRVGKTRTTSAHVAKRSKKRASAAIEAVRFERTSESTSTPGGCSRGCDSVFVKVDGKPSYEIVRQSQSRIRLVIAKASVPSRLVRTESVGDRTGGTERLTTMALARSGAVAIEIERRGEDDGRVVRTPHGLRWTFYGRAAPGPNAKRTVKTVVREEGPKNVPTVERTLAGSQGGAASVETVDNEEAGFTAHVSGQAARPPTRFRGRRIDLDLKDADIHNVLRLFADVGRVNIVTADDVAGNITIRMRRVPWDQALDVVLQAKGLGMVRQGNLIRVAPLAQLQKERELLLEQQKQELDLAPLETRLIPVSYAQADEVQARAKDFLSPRGSLAVDERTNVLIARDVAGNLDHIEELVRSLDTQTPQVLIEARIVEATSRYLRDVGIQWGGDATFSEATGNPTGIAFPSRVGLAGGNYDNLTPTGGLSPFQRQLPNPNFAVNLPATTGTGQGGALGLTFGSVDNNFNLGVRLSASEASGMLRIVSSPRILTLDNREARINQGTLIPFSQVSAQGVQTTFQEAKLQLLVRPHVTADGSIAMHVKINRDEPDFNQTSARGDPTILKREAETDLLVMDGHTAVIGGIYTRNTGRNLDQIPFFGDIPVLGVLFQRRRASDSRNELVIFLTPRIVNRAEALGR